VCDCVSECVCVCDFVCVCDCVCDNVRVCIISECITSCVAVQQRKQEEDRDLMMLKMKSMMALTSSMGIFLGVLYPWCVCCGVVCVYCLVYCSVYYWVYCWVCCSVLCVVCIAVCFVACVL